MTPRPSRSRLLARLALAHFVLARFALASFALASSALINVADGAAPDVSVNQNALQQLAGPQKPKAPIPHPKPAPNPPRPPLQRRIALPLPPPPAPTPPQSTAPGAPPPVANPATAHPPTPPIIPTLALNFASHSATLSATNIAKIRQFAAQKTVSTRRITVAAAAIGTAQHPSRAYRLAFARGHAVRDSLIKAGIPLTRIIVQSQILPPGSQASDQRAILTLTP
jgi:outer membrane protein OmpA-like peptidoglycan-associated protein